MFKKFNNFVNGEIKKVQVAVGNRKLEEIKKLLEYAEVTYGCNFPEEFAKKMCDVGYKNWLITTQIIDAIFVEWNLWKPYVSEKSYNQFMQAEIEEMFRKKTTTILASKESIAYIGRKATLIKVPPAKMATAISELGTIKMNL